MTTWNQKSQRTSPWDTERWLSMMVYYNYFAYTYDDTITYDLDFIPLLTPYGQKYQRLTTFKQKPSVLTNWGNKSQRTTKWS